MKRIISITYLVVRSIFLDVRCQNSDVSKKAVIKYWLLTSDIWHLKWIPLRIKFKQFTLVFTTLLFFSLSPLSAQVQSQQKVSLSLRAGLNLAQIFGSGSQAFNHFGFGGGAKLGWRFSNRWSFDPEVLYSMKGAARNPDIKNNDYYSFSVDLDYIDVPLLFNYHFKAGKKLNFSVEFGPAIGFLVRQKAYENGSAINSTNTGFNIYDISLMAGLNYYLPKGFALNVRFQNSIVPIQPTSGTLPWGVSSINIGQLNSVLNFSLLYKFDFRSKEQRILDGEIVDKPVKEKKPKKPKKQKGDIIDEDE